MSEILTQKELDNLYKKSKDGDNSAKLRLAKLLLFGYSSDGKIIDCDRKEAIYLFKELAQIGNVEAKKLLEEIESNERG